MHITRSLPGCTVFYPADAVATERSVELAANTQGICFVRFVTSNQTFPCLIFHASDSG